MILFAVNAALIIGAVHWIGCATNSGGNGNSEPTDPGMYRLKGYGGQTAYGSSSDSMWTAGDLDIDGTVGHPFYISTPNAYMVPTSVTWNGDIRIVSGTLPTGLQLDYGTWAITGIPTERGHWIVNIEVSNLHGSDGKQYGGFKQQIRFHITGSGEVNQ